MKWRYFKKDESRNKYTIMGQLWDGRVVQIPGDHDREVTEHKMRCIASLSRSKKLGELPDESLADWIKGLPEKEAKRYVDLGLLPNRLLDKRRPINDLIDEFAIHMKANLEDRSRWTKQKPEMVRRVYATIGPDASFDNLDQDDVNIALKKMMTLGGRRKGQTLSQKSKREYVFAMKSFCEWMVNKRGATRNPLEGMIAPAAKGAPVLNRRPLKVAEFSKLVNYLRIAPQRYAHQMFPWTPEDRLMVYWTAVMTGFRANELRNLTRASVNFDADPVLVTVEGWVAKNRTKATVPIGADFARVLKDYSLHRHPNTPLLRMPGRNQLTRGLYRDLDAAGVRRIFEDGAVVDFHTLRSTAICWWLTENKLDLLKVQRRARLKTLALVQEYVRNYVPEYEELVDKETKVVDFNQPLVRVS